MWLKVAVALGLVLAACGGDDEPNEATRRVCETFWPNLLVAANDGAGISELTPFAEKLADEAEGASGSVRNASRDVRTAILNGQAGNFQDAGDRLDAGCQASGL